LINNGNKCRMVGEGAGSIRVWIWRGHIWIMSVALAIAIIVIIAKNGMGKTSLEHHIWYTTRTSFWCRFRIWSQNSKILSVSWVITWFMLISSTKDQSNHNTCSNHWKCHSCYQRAVLYA
jgi:hypothetical protein